MLRQTSLVRFRVPNMDDGHGFLQKRAREGKPERVRSRQLLPSSVRLITRWFGQRIEWELCSTRNMTTRAQASMHISNAQDQWLCYYAISSHDREGERRKHTISSGLRMPN